MRRLLAAIRWDIVVQFRQGFYYVSAVVLFILLLLFSQLRGAEGVDVGRLMPALVVANLIMTTFYFAGALVLLEKGEGSLAGLVVTPLRVWEYLASKIGSLTLLAVIENLLMILLIYGTDFALLPLLAGMILLSAFYTLAGFLSIARYDSINEYLLPSVLIVTLFVTPLLDYFGLWRTPLFYLHPVQPALLLMRAAFAPIEFWQMLYSVAGSLLWVGLSFAWARQQFDRFVVRAAGT